MYTITLTREEYAIMPWFIAHGYFPEDVFYESDDNGEYVACNDSITLHIPEHIAWSLLDWREHNAESLYTCMGQALRQKWEELESAIV